MSTGGVYTSSPHAPSIRRRQECRPRRTASRTICQGAPSSKLSELLDPATFIASEYQQQSDGVTSHACRGPAEALLPSSPGPWHA